jgi:hypothetical protein
MTHRLGVFVFAAFLVSCNAPPQYPEVQVNALDHNSPSAANFTTQTQPSIARRGSNVVIGYASSRNAAVYGVNGWKTQNGFAWSGDGGATFTDGGLVPPGPFRFFGNPAFAYDKSGFVYYATRGATVQGYGRVFVGRSTTTTTPVSFGTPIAVILGMKAYENGTIEEKPAIAIDTTSGADQGMIYLAWSEVPYAGSPNAQIIFAKTMPQTLPQLSQAGVLSPSFGGFHHGVDIAIAPNGNVYIVWSTLSDVVNPGPATVNLLGYREPMCTLCNPDMTDFAPEKIVASYTSTARNIGTGSIALRTLSAPHIAVDQTPVGSPTSGNVYVVFEGKPTSSPNPRSEIYFTRSTNGGATWLPARAISAGAAVTYGGDSTTNDNWLPSIAVSPVTGHIKVIFYSRREDPQNQAIRVYEAGSTDGGTTWYGRPFSAASFQPSTGYDLLFPPDYMGDFLAAFADASGLLAAWGDSRNQCAPPAGATAPCSPVGRGDQDVWSRRESDAFGPDLFITPWGFVSGQGPLWQTPDIFVVDNANNPTVAHINVHNNLRARVANLGLATSDATVQFSFTPSGMGLTSTAFENIGPPLSISAAAAPTSQIVPIDWFLSPNDTNGGAWGGHAVSEFDHFCVHVIISSPSDINVSNNDAYDNFVNVTAKVFKPMKFLIGNPFQRDVRASVLLGALPDGYSASLGGDVSKGAVLLKRGEVRMGTITMSRPAGYEEQRREKDVIEHASLIIDGKIVSGISYLLAKANIVPKPRATRAVLRTSPDPSAGVRRTH